MRGGGGGGERVCVSLGVSVEGTHPPTPVHGRQGIWGLLC